MCITKKELEEKVQTLRSLKAMKEELEDNIKDVEHSIIDYMTENGLDTEFTSDGKITYKSQIRKTLDKKQLEADLGSLEDYTKTTQYNVLRVK